MPKQYTKTIESCTECPNALIVASISPNHGPEIRCKGSRYRNNVYRLIHYEGGRIIPPWCSLGNAEILDPSY